MSDGSLGSAGSEVSLGSLWSEVTLARNETPGNLKRALTNPKIDILPKLVPVIWPFSGPKKSFFGLFESCFEDVQKLFRHYF